VECGFKFPFFCELEYENQRNKDLENEIESVKQKHKDDLQNLLD